MVKKNKINLNEKYSHKGKSLKTKCTENFIFFFFFLET